MKIPDSVLSGLCLATLLAAFSCSKNNDAAVNPPDIYAFGLVNKAVTTWKNGVPTSVTDGSITAYPKAMVVVGTDVYVAGVSYDNGSISVAKYWKNGVGVAVTDGTKYAGAYGIAVNGTDVYVVGYEGDANNGNWTPKYWKNGAATTLPVYGASVFSAATTLSVTGSDVHVVGWESTLDSVIAKYWKNGVAIPVTHNAKYGYSNYIKLDGNITYIAGGEVNPGKNEAAKYWKNGTEFALTDGTWYANANMIEVVDGNVYVAGFDNNVATSWKNGVATALSEASKVGEALSISVSRGDVYVAGTLKTPGTNALAGSVLWKNGVPIAPFLGTDPTVQLGGAIAITH